MLSVIARFGLQEYPVNRLDVATLDTPLGPLRVISSVDVLLAATFSHAESHEAVIRNVHPDAKWVDVDSSAPATAIGRYFAGELSAVDDVDVDPIGTPFQILVWRELVRIPAGEVIAYGELATRVGNPTASRAVGAANGRNPIPIVIPCHRVIGADGTLTGYAGGVKRKKWLLDHERRQADLFPPRARAGTEHTARS
jgi:methylated-DNA-[protein]-cysteine S-methyltransferase